MQFTAATSRLGSLSSSLSSSSSSSTPTIGGQASAIRHSLPNATFPAPSPSSSSSSSSSSSPSPLSINGNGMTHHGHGHGGGGYGQSHRRSDRILTGLARVVPLIMDVTMRVLGPILVLFAWALFAGITYIYFWHILPLREMEVSSPIGIFWTGIGVYILLNLYYNHAMAVFTSPGFIPDTVPIPSNIESLIAEEAPLVRRGEGFTKHCKQCRKPKPERSHHCHICHRCVLKMDHHCPWIANCVGHGNYKFFFLFLAYLWVGCIYLVMMCLPTFFYTSPPELRRHEGPVFFAVVLGTSAAVALGIMGVLHLYLILTNQTTIELYHNRRMKNEANRRGEQWSNPYDLGWRKNFQSVFGVGQYWFSWALPGKPDVGDGLRYPRNNTPEYFHPK